MQLKFKKIGLLTTVFVYCASFLLQSNLLFFQTWAQEVNTPRVNIVAILVDDKIYDGISDGLEWYATEYVQKKLADSKALVIPIDLTKVHAYDIYRMMENIYFDGLKDVNSQLIGLIMFGDIPLPVVNQDGYIFPTVYPYVDFEDQKYVWNDSIQYFVPNGNPKGQAEIWHGLINYGTDVDAYMGLFSKIDAYLSDPDEFIGDSMWYEDFIAQKEGFLNEDYKYYRNSIMFGEDIGYQRHSTLMKTMFGEESANDSAEIVEELSEKMGVDLGSKEVLDTFLEGGKTMHTTKMNQQEIETSYLADYNDLFSKNILSTIRENIFAGGRWIKLYYAADGKASNIVDVDNSSSMIQLKDTMYLGNKDLQGVIENLNLLMEDMVDRKISENRYDMDVVIPVSYMKTTGKRAAFKCHKLVSRFDNYYFGNNARYIDKAQELSIYRGTYRNLSDLDGVTYDSLLEGNNPIVSEYDPVDVTLKSIGGSYGIFSNQVAGNRGLMMTSVDRDLDVYDEEKTDADASLDFRDLFSIIKRLTWWKDCDEEDCENLFDFAQRWRGGASPINLDEESVSKGRYKINNLRTHESWRPIFDMGGFQSLVPGDDEGMDGIGWHDGEGPGPQWAATSYKAYEKYSSPTQREGWERKGGWYLIYENHNPDVHKPFIEMDYWHLSPGIINGWDFSKESKSIFNVTKKSSLLSCSWLKESTLSEQYTYKVVSSLSKHVSTTEDEINGIDRDRYGESGTLGQYYRDLKKSYQDVRDDTLEILDRLSNLIKNIKTVNDLINTKIEALDTEASNLSEVADEIVNLNSEIESLKEDLESAEDEDKQGIEAEIKEKEKSLNEAEEKRKAIEGTISEFLKQISEYIDRENLLLTDIYKLIMSIFVDNIFSVMEYISYTEGGNPENFYLGLPNREKVGFLSEWISTIEGIESGIKQDGKDIIVYYNQAYDMVEDQQRAWEVLAEKLKEESDSSAEEIDKVTEKMNNVVVIDESKTDYGGENTEDEQEGVGGGPSQFKLERDSAVEAIEGPDGLFDRFDCSQGVNAMFYRLIGADTVGPAIIEAAKNDSDFKVWLIKNEINFNKFSQTDWINQYAQWAKGPGYDSAGAKKNHDLLAGVSEHMAGMNILTPDRPIDSPRYISMQSVAGKDMKFIYPDLFKVEVYELKGQNSAGFDVHKLLKPEGIKNNLIKYLKGKVDEYNQILDEHCGSALGDSAYFGRLRELGYDMATPDVGLHHCGDKFEYDEFVEALGGEEMLKVIADILYYQSLTNKKKKSSPLVEEDIDFIKKSFSLNDKRKLTLEDYLTQGMEKIKNPLLVIPMYELYGYEVAYVNSNGRDYIFSDDDLSFDKLSGIDETTFKADGLENVQPTKQQNEYNDECNIPPSGRLPLFKLSGTSVSSPWFEGFKCWLKKTKDEPFKIKLKFDSSLGEIFSTDSVEDYVKDSELGQNLSDWGDSFSKYTDSWESIIKTKSEFDPDVAITRMQVEAEQHNQSLLGGDTGISNLMGDMTRGIKVENSNDLLSDSTPSSELRIESAFDVGNVSVQFYGTGEDGCLKVGEDTICKGSSITKSFNPKTNPFTGLVMSADHVAGKYALDLKISAGGQYIEKVLKYTVSPSSLDNAEIIVEDNKSIAGLLTPVKVIGYDKYGNVISWGFEKYNFTTTQGRFLKDGAYQDSFSTNDFRDLNFYYQAPLDAVDGSEAVIQISSERNPGVYLATHHQILAQAAPEIKLNGSTILKGKDNLEVNQSYQLTDDESVYDGDSLNVSRLQKLDIEMRDLGGKLVDIDSQIMVTSKNGMVIIGQLQKDENGKDKFFETPKNYMSGGYATVYYYASTKAGDDVISIDIPGLDTRKINLKVYPSQTSNVQINILNGYVELEKYTDFEVFTLDKWGNSTDTTVEIHYDPSYVEIQEVPGYVKEIYRDDSLVIDSCKVENGYLKTSIFGAGPGITEVEVKGYTSVIFKVDSRLFPEEKLNIMYLNYFGNDWGNQWGYFSDNNKYIEMLMNNSEKIITTTTQLISEEKIKKMLWKIQPGFKISSDAAVDTVMVMDGKNINVLIGGMTSMQVPLPSLAWMSVGQESMENILSNSVGASQNYAFFVAADSKYSVDKNGVLYDGGKRIGSILGGEIALQLSDASLDNGDNIWDITYKGAECGSLVLHYPKFKPSDSDFENPGKGYVVSKTFTNGTTDNLSSVGIFDMSTEFELDTSYKSIQNSDEIEERVGFLGDFKNITLFAEGEIVGEATKKYGSEFVINLGDPLLSRKDKNEFVHGTMFDGGIGNEIYVDSENNIFGNYQIDFNNDKLKDLLVVYVDGTVKLAKNYGGTPDMRNMQELMRLAVGIKEVFVGDVDGNKYDDIIVFTENNQLRVYMNDKGQFDVDGKVACLNQNVFGGEISSTPTSLEGISQIFVEDMDLDGIMDVLVYDEKGYVKVFYGGTTNGGPNYLSMDAYSCDSGWYNRQVRNTTVITALGVQVSGDPIFDNSMLYREGMDIPVVEIEKSKLKKYGIYFDPDSFTDDNIKSKVKEREWNSDGDMSDATLDIMENFDVKKASQKYTDISDKFVNITLYENTLLSGEGNNYVFAPSSFLNPDDPDDIGSVWKNYSLKSGSTILQDGDIVTVRVTVKASDEYSFRGAFADVIQGPWNLYFDQDEIFEGIRFVTGTGNAVIKKKDGNFAYIIDNIELSPGEKMIFEYDLEFHRLPLRTLSLSYQTYWSDDIYPDVKMQSVDGCEKNFDVYVNGGGSRSFSYDVINLKDMVDEEYLDEESETEDYTEDILSIGSDVNQIPGIVGDSISRISLLNGDSAISISNDESGKKSLENVILQKIQEGGLESLNINLNIDLNLFEDQMNDIENVVDDITKGMCNGFSFGGSNNCKGLPVPFNQAFLAPGKYHLFGCWELPLTPLDKGLPIFFFPGTFYTPVGVPVPMPWGLKNDEMDDFIWVPGGTYGSFIRIYAAPTLTAQLGVAICISPDRIWRKVPSPLSDIAGNCIVFAVKPQCKGDDSGFGSENKDDLDNPEETYPDFIEDVRDSGVCLQSQKGPMVTLAGMRSSPFNMYSYSSQVKQLPTQKRFSINDTLGTITWKNKDVNGGLNNDVEYSTSFMGIIELETSSYIGADEADETKNSIYIGDVDILGGEFSVNKIRGGIQQGVRKLLIDKWLDPQIRYIVNQLTKMHVNIKVPNVTNLIDNEAQTLKNVSSNIGDIWSGTKSSINDSNLTDPITNWSDITYDSFKDFNKSIANPFESLATMMNESNIINISTETLVVKIPMIFKEDIDAYQLYLQQRLDTNSAIIEEWEMMFNTFATSCAKEPTQEAQQKCEKQRQEAMSSFIEFKNTNWVRFQNQIYANLIILQKYRDFPFEIYERIHVIDRYMSEIASLINNTLGYLSYWTNANSQRFVGYVDAIVLIINIIKTYQLLINFSIEWGQNCGNCARDTYDQYSCKLSMLCDMIQLPIIQIPNFKLPNITIDLTNIDLGLDIVLPEFNFQPIRVDLPELPNLPEPMMVNIQLFDLPNIPVLPEPPELPELPSFIPEVELELPILPPAPEVPKLPNSIEGVIKIADLIGKIYCIVKGQFGLVGESSVKAKIEQLTQRTYPVDWIDNIMDFTNWSVAPVHNYGVDYEIDSYVDLQFNFKDFYDYLDTLTKSINNLTTSTVNSVNSKVDSLINENPITDIRDSLDGMGVDVKLGKADINIDENGLMSDDIEYVDYESGKSRLKDVLAYFKGEVNNTSFSDSIGGSINKIENQIDKHSDITANKAGIENVRTAVMDYLDKERVNYDALADMINSDYDGFLAMVDAQSNDESVKGKDENKMLTFNVQLFNVDPSTRDSIKNIAKDNPYKTILDNKQSIVDGYWDAINNNSADDLGLSKSQYLVLRNDISTMRKNMNVLQDLVKPVSSTNLIAKNGAGQTNKSLVAGLRIGSQMEVATVVDASLFSKGIYEKNADGKFTKVIYSESFTDDMKDSYYHTSHSSKHDIILWDENSIYKKCFGQACLSYGGSYGKYYHSSTVKEIPNKETWLEFDGDTILKIADKYEEVKDRKVANQDFDMLTFSWTLEDVDAYLLKLVERIDNSYEKEDYNNKVPVIYVLALPDYVDENDLYANGVKLELLNQKIDEIQDLYGKDLVQIVHYDSHKKFADIGINNIDRKWYYMRVASLSLNKDTYNINSPWSNQIVAGRQIAGDGQGPTAEAKLYRPSVSKVVSEGDTLEGYVGTRYKLIVDWEDNVAMSSMNLSREGKVLTGKSLSSATGSISIDIDIHTKAGTETFVSKGVDQFGNEVEKTITMTFLVPDIDITDIAQNPDGESVSITAEISQDIDQGNVTFQRKRGTSRKSMMDDYPLGPGDTIVVGGPYSMGGGIAMYGKNGDSIASVDPDTAEIKINSGYKDDYEIRAIVEDGALLKIYDKKNNKSVFSLSIPAKECVKFEAKNFNVVDLPEKGKMGEFNGGKAVYNNGTNVLFASPTCHLYSEFGLEGTYDFDRELQAVVLTLYLPSDLTKKNPIKVWFKAKPFENK